MIVVAVMSVGSAFIFVTKFHSSKDVYDTTMASAVPAPGSSSDGAEDGKGLDTEKDGKAEKAKSKDKKKDKKKKDKKKGKKDGTEKDKEEGSSVLNKILVPLDSIVVIIGKVDNNTIQRH